MAAMNVKSVDLCVRDNSRNHSTSLFHLSRKNRLLVRRCQRIVLRIDLDEPYTEKDLDVNTFSLVFTYAADNLPSASRNSLIKLHVGLTTPCQLCLANWQAYSSPRRTPSSVIFIHVIAGNDALIGEWRLSVLINTPNGATSEYKVPDTIYLLFNPWSKDDSVFLDDEEARKEYAVSDSGYIYQGVYNNFDKFPWTFGQYEKGVLDATLYIMLGDEKKSISQFGDAVIVSQILSDSLRRAKDKMVIKGNWEASPKVTGDDRKPWHWNNAAEILRLYFEKKKTVKYAQCFVYAAICNAMCRALGLPARVVSVFECSTDVMGNLLIERFIDQHNKLERFRMNDSPWIYHTFNEVWLRRPDLKNKDYLTGWQAIDATETLGPMSVKALKKGDVDISYDGFRFLSCVNADKVTWKLTGFSYMNETYTYKLVEKDTSSIGKCISTHGVGNVLLDLTGEYKHLEHTPEEREVFFRAIRKSDNSLAKQYYNQEGFPDISLNYNDESFILLGEPLQAVVQVKNKSDSKTYTLKGKLYITSTLYNGGAEKTISIYEVDSKIKPEEALDFKVEATFDKYEDVLVSWVFFKVVFIVDVVEVNFTAQLSDHYLKIKWPEINIDCGEQQVVNESFRLGLSFKNTLPIAIPKGYFAVSAPGLLKETKLLTSETPPGQNVACSTTVRPRSTGKKIVAVEFVSDLLPMVAGSKKIYVKNS